MRKSNNNDWSKYNGYHEVTFRSELESSMRTSVQTASPKPEEDDSLSAREEESTWSCDRPSISGMESSEDGTEES